MTGQSPKQKEVVERVMHAFKEGQLDQRDSTPVTNPKQAIAIALHEAGASDRESPEKNNANLAKTRRRLREKGTAAERTRASLSAEARRRGLPGCSRMTKPELERALQS